VTLRLGVSGGPIPRDPNELTEEDVRQLAELGVSVLTTHFQPSPVAVRGAPAERVRRLLADHGLSVVQATGYNPQLTHPDPEIRRAELERLRAAFDTAHDLGAEMIISGCGSWHPSHFYGPHPANHTPAARAYLVDSLRVAAPWAEAAGIILALECHVTTALDTPAHIREVLEAVDSPWVRANFDPVNLLGSLDAVWDNASAMREMWDAIGVRYAPSAHVKDVRPDAELVVHISEAPPGQGALDLDVFFDVCQRLGEGAALIVEHLPRSEALAAISYVKLEAERRGHAFAPPRTPL
jgi:sugar phosphate isomerase/epimerase